MVRRSLFYPCLTILVALSKAITTNKTTQTITKVAYIPGTVVLGGLFPVHHPRHNKTHETKCGSINTNRGIQRLEAMLFAIDTVNNDTSFLEGIKLGATIVDTYSTDTYALEQSLEFVKASIQQLSSSHFICEDNSTPTETRNFSAAVGVIGGSLSTVSIQVTSFLRLFGIPQVSYASTSASLSDKFRFPMFARTVPPDTFQARAMVDIVQYFNWTYVSAVASQGEYGEKGIEFFQNEAKTRNICIASYSIITSSGGDIQYIEILSKLMSKNMAKGVVLFVGSSHASKLLKTMAEMDLPNDFVWIASDGWGAQESVVKGHKHVASGAFTIELQTKNIPKFDTYFTGLNPFKNTRNPWFKEYWECIHNCTLSQGEGQICTGHEIDQNYVQESKVQFVYDAVLVFAKAMDVCLNRSDCMADAKFNGSQLYEIILNSTFRDNYGNEVKFDPQGDVAGRYKIYNYQIKSTGDYSYKEVGLWDGRLKLDLKKVEWNSADGQIPKSQCSPTCRPTQITRTHDVCCWVCQDCQPWEYKENEYTCVTCGTGRWPRKDLKSCYILPLHYIKWNTVYAILPVSFSTVGIITTMVIVTVFIKMNDTPVVRASGRELAYLILAGCFLCYIMTFFLILKPSSVTCAIQRAGIGLGLAIIYSALLAKTNRIHRIFSNATKSTQRPAYISPKAQLVISLIFISVQVVITIIWLIVEPPGVTEYMPQKREPLIVLECKANGTPILICIVYNMVLIAICTVYAVKTRKIPENFNESKFIGFTMYTTCIIWLAFVPIYFGAGSSVEIQSTTMCLAISLSATVALMCLFGPKVYIIVFLPEQNKRHINVMLHKKKGGGPCTTTQETGRS